MKKIFTLCAAILLFISAFADKGTIVLTSPVDFQVLAVSPNGKWACGISGNGVTTPEHGVLWNLQTGEFTYLSTSGSSTAFDVSDDGIVVGSGGYYTDGRWHSLGGQAMSISRDGRTIVGYTSRAGGYAPVKWVDGKLAVTYPYENNVAQCYTVSDDGQLAAGWGYTSIGSSTINRTIALWNDSTVEYLSPKATFAEAGRRFSPDATKLLCESMGHPFVYNLDTKDRFRLPFIAEYTATQICSYFVACYVNDEGDILGEEQMQDPMTNASDVYAYIYDASAGKAVKLYDWLKDEHGVEIDAQKYKLYRGVEMSNDGKAISMLAYECQNGEMTGASLSIVVLLDREVDICPPVTLNAEKLNGLNSVRLTWKEPLMNASEVLGYNIYRDGVLVVEGLSELAYIDVLPAEGQYTYAVSALYPGDEADIESDKSEPVTIDVYPEPLNSVRNIEWHAVNLNDMKLRWAEPQPNSPSFTFFDYNAQATGFGGGVISFSTAILLPVDIVANYAPEYAISRVAFMPRSAEARYTIKVYVNGVEMASQPTDVAALSYNNMNTIDLDTPVFFDALDDVMVAVDIDASTLTAPSYDLMGMSYGSSTPGYSDLLRQSVEPEYYSLNQSSLDNGMGEVLVSWAISAVLSKVDENGHVNFNNDIVAGYEIFRDDNRLAQVTSLNYYDTDLTAGRHNYKIVAHYADGGIAEPAVLNINFAPKYEVLPPVEDVEVAAYTNTIEARWSAPLNNDATVLSYARGNSSGKGITRTGASELIEYTVAHEYPSSYFDWYEGYNIVSLRFYPTAEAIFGIVLEVNGIDHEMIVLEEMGTDEGYTLNTWNDVKLASPYKIKTGDNIRVKLVCTDVDPTTYPITMDSGRGNVGVSDLYSFNYYSFSSAYSDGGLSGNWMLGMRVANDNTDLLPVNGYDVLIDGEKANDELITEPRFVQQNLDWKEAQTHRIRINTTYDVNGADYVVEGKQIVFNVLAGVERIDIDRVQVYPNPATTYIAVEGSVDMLSLYDLSGRMVAQATTNTIDVSQLPAGNYLLVIENNQGSRTVKVLIAQ